MSTSTLTTGTFREYGSSLREQLGSPGISKEEQRLLAIETGKQAYFLAVQLVFDNDFSRSAKQSFPQMRVDYSMLSLICWAQRLRPWFENLTPAEKRLFLTTELTFP